MKLLRITAKGLPLFKKMDLIFYAQQRVEEEHRNILNPLFSNIYQEGVYGISKYKACICEESAENAIMDIIGS